MNYETIIINKTEFGQEIILNRPERKNSINSKMAEEISNALKRAEEKGISVVVLKGQEGFFCTGMDFEAFTNSDPNNSESFSPDYMELLRYISLFPGIVISLVDGEVMAGGVGLVAASDLVIATQKARFSLSEALWGLLPAMVTPYLIRRIGFQNAYRMTLTTMPVSAARAYEINLADEFTESEKEANETLKRIWLRVGKLSTNTIKEMKEYFRKMWIITEETEETAKAEIIKLTGMPQVRENIENFVKYGKFPWSC
jgi:polyketide biosynthesis enoyl-CoA hydratase PksH